MEETSDVVAQASARFATALDSLEAAVRRQMEGRRETTALDSEIQHLSEDRSRLAEELDRAQGRAARLESAASHVGERLDAAIATVGELLEGSRVP